MRLIQPVLIILFCIGAYLYFRFGRTRTVDRFIMIMLVASGSIMILNPDLTTEIANLIGVGRGTDLLLYFGLIMIGFALFFLYSKMRSMEAQLTEFVRAAAIQEAISHHPPGKITDITQQVSDE